MALFGSSSNASSSNPKAEEIKTAVMRQLQQEAALSNARALISKVNEHCFEHCVPNPGPTLSAQEGACLSACMEKYISMWNSISRTYINRAGQESKRLGQDAVALNSLATGDSE